MIAQLTQFSDSSTIFSALGINLQSFFIQLVTFLIAFLVLRQFAFKPILKMLEDRRQTIENGLTLGEKMQVEQEKLEKAVASELHKARQEADTIVSSAENEAKLTQQAAEETARKRAESMIEDAKAQIKQTAARERSRFEKELVGLVSEVSETIIGEKVDAQKDAVLIDKALKARRAA